MGCKVCLTHLHFFLLYVIQETPPSPEVATFTVFFMAFTAVVGKELMGMNYDSEDEEESKTILSTYSHTLSEETESGSEITNCTNTSLGEKRGESVENTDGKIQSKVNGLNATTGSTSNQSGPALKSRFRDSLNLLEIEEAKATGRAQLGLAFEMLTMMKKRALKADPEAYQSLIDACGRVGDTKRASDLLARMHEDGIVADGTVYACLVAAFSADTAWRNGTKDEDLPGACNVVTLVLFVRDQHSCSNAKRPLFLDF